MKGKKPKKNNPPDLGISVSEEIQTSENIGG